MTTLPSQRDLELPAHGAWREVFLRSQQAAQRVVRIRELELDERQIGELTEPEANELDALRRWFAHAYVLATHIADPDQLFAPGSENR